MDGDGEGGGILGRHLRRRRDEEASRAEFDVVARLKRESVVMGPARRAGARAHGACISAMTQLAHGTRKISAGKYSLKGKTFWKFSLSCC
jgi:hypothetical protein